MTHKLKIQGVQRVLCVRSIMATLEGDELRRLPGSGAVNLTMLETYDEDDYMSSDC